MLSYACPVNDTHPDIKIGEPIPKIEPRIDQDVLKATRDIIRVGRWFLGLMLLLGIVSRILSLGLLNTLAIFLGAVIVFVAVVLIQRRRTLNTTSVKPRKKWAEMKQNKWSIPARYTIESSILGTATGFVYLFLMPSYSGLSIGILGTLGLVIGITLFIFSRIAREPGQICCEKCEYPLLGLTLPCMCPECGYSLLTPKYTTDRPHIRSPALTWGGPALALFGLAIALTSFLRPGIFYAPMPRAALLALAPTDEQALKQLLTTPLSPTETTHLIDRLIDNHLNRGEWDFYMEHEQRQWLDAQLAADTISAEQLDRLMSSLHPIKIEAPTTGQIGEPITLTITTEYTRMPGSDFRTRYYFGGFTIGDNPTVHERSEKMRWPMYIRSDRLMSTRRDDDAPEYAFTPTEPGEITIRARIFRVLQDPNINRGFQRRWMAWDDQGQPEILIPFSWSRIDNIETTITITP